jgi:signal transduction histidine kinase
VTIRTRLTWWYAGLMFISLLAMSGLSYYNFVARPRGRTLNDAKIAKELIIKDQDEDFSKFSRIVFWCGVPAALLALGGGWWLMRKALTPVTALTDAARRINERNLGERLPQTRNGDELDQLTEVFNAMTARLENAFQRVREFTLHASHELKTPLTVMHAALDTALADASLTAAQRDRLLSQLDEVQRLAKIVDALTLLTKADAGQINLHREIVHLDELVREAFEDAQVLGRPYEVKVRLLDCDAVAVSGDRHRLRQLLLNLTDNAVKYNHEDGLVEMALNRRNGNAVVTIRNTGCGIPPELRSRVFDRFFRGEAAHSNRVEGCGLGLSIAQWIVAAHGGSIDLASESAKETIVTVVLPTAGPT